MALNGGKIKEVKVTLLLSSRAEMQKVIEKARAATAFMPTKMQLPSAEAFTNQFVNKKLPEANVTNVIPNASQSLMANYLQHSATSVVPMMNNFQMKATKESVLSQATLPQVGLAANPQIPLYYANMMNAATPADYLNYMNMANATANYPIDANKLRDLYNKDKRVDIPVQQKPSNDYNRYQRSTSRDRQRSRSPIGSRYDSDDKKDRKRRTRFSSPEKATPAVVNTNNPLLQHIKPLIQQQPKPTQPALNILQAQVQPQPLINMNMNSMSNVNLNPIANNSKLPNNIWDVPPPLNLNSYTQFQPNSYNSTNNSSSSNNNINNNNSNGSGGVGTCIKVANIDKETTYSDVRKFFGGLPIGNNDIKFLTDDNGDHTGVALVRFVSSDSKKQSLTKNGWQLKSTQIMITSISEDDFENGLDSSRARSSRDNYRRDNRDNRRDNYDDSRRDRYNDRFRDRSNSRERNYDRNDRNDRGDRNDRFQNRNMSNNFNNRNGSYQNNRYNSNSNNNDRFDRDRDRGSNYGPGNRSNNGYNNNNNNRRDFRRDNDGRNRNFRDNEPEEKIEYIPDENFNVLVIDDIPDKNEADLFQAFPDILGITIDKYTAYCKFRTHEAAKAVLENRFLHYIRNKRVFVEKGAEAQFDDLAKKYGKFDNPEFADEIKSNDDKKAAEKSTENKEQSPSTSTADQEEQKKPAYESRDPRQKAQNNDRPSSNSANAQPSNFKTDCILIKNLDLKSSIEDVEKFFVDVNIQRNQMRTHILLDKRGKFCL